MLTPPERRILSIGTRRLDRRADSAGIQAYCLGRSLGISVPLTTYFAFIPIILLVMLLPISVNGLGTSQIAFVGLFSRVGVAQGPAFALSVLFLALGVIGNLPGGLLYALGRREQARPR